MVLAPYFITPAAIFYPLPGPIKCEVDTWIRQPLLRFDVNEDRSSIIEHEKVGCMSAATPVYRCTQEERLCGDPADSRFEVSE